MKPNRRELLGAGFAGAVGLLGIAVPRAEGHEGNLTPEQVRQFALTPRSANDYMKLAAHFRKMQKGAIAEATLYQNIADQYNGGCVGATDGQTWNVAKALEHAAQHAFDTAEALNDVVAAYEGIAESFNYSG